MHTVSKKYLTYKNKQQKYKVLLNLSLRSKIKCLI